MPNIVYTIAIGVGCEHFVCETVLLLSMCVNKIPMHKKDSGVNNVLLN